jgi:hypothetical protein
MPSCWWVNHKQTCRQETDGGHIWSPKANANGARNVSCDNLTRCQGGDGVFSYANGRISQIGLVENERLSGANGLLLSPHADKLFDRHWISFDAGGELLGALDWLRIGLCVQEGHKEGVRFGGFA